MVETEEMAGLVRDDILYVVGVGVSCLAGHPSLAADAVQLHVGGHDFSRRGLKDRRGHAERNARVVPRRGLQHNEIHIAAGIALVVDSNADFTLVGLTKIAGLPSGAGGAVPCVEPCCDGLGQVRVGRRETGGDTESAKAPLAACSAVRSRLLARLAGSFGAGSRLLEHDHVVAVANAAERLCSAGCGCTVDRLGAAAWDADHGRGVSLGALSAVEGDSARLATAPAALKADAVVREHKIAAVAAAQRSAGADGAELQVIANAGGGPTHGLGLLAVGAGEEGAGQPCADAGALPAYGADGAVCAQLFAGATAVRAGRCGGIENPLTAVAPGRCGWRVAGLAGRAGCRRLAEARRADLAGRCAVLPLFGEVALKVGGGAAAARARRSAAAGWQAAPVAAEATFRTGIAPFGRLALVGSTAAALFEVHQRFAITPGARDGGQTYRPCGAASRSDAVSIHADRVAAAGRPCLVEGTGCHRRRAAALRERLWRAALCHPNAAIEWRSGAPVAERDDLVALAVGCRRDAGRHGAEVVAVCHRRPGLAACAQDRSLAGTVGRLSLAGQGDVGRVAGLRAQVGCRRLRQQHRAEQGCEEPKPARAHGCDRRKAESALSDQTGLSDCALLPFATERSAKTSPSNERRACACPPAPGSTKKTPSDIPAGVQAPSDRCSSSTMTSCPGSNCGAPATTEAQRPTRPPSLRKVTGPSTGLPLNCSETSSRTLRSGCPPTQTDSTDTTRPRTTSPLTATSSCIETAITVVAKARGGGANDNPAKKRLNKRLRARMRQP